MLRHPLLTPYSRSVLRKHREQGSGGWRGALHAGEAASDKNASYLLQFVKLQEKRLGLRAVTYSYLTRLKAAATREGLSLSKLQEISQRGKEKSEIGIKRYRGTVRVRESGVRTAERISYKAPLTISQKENPLYPSSKPDALPHLHPSSSPHRRI